MLLAVMAGTFTGASRSEMNLARNLSENARPEALADGGVCRAVYVVLANECEPVFAAELALAAPSRRTIVSLPASDTPPLPSNGGRSLISWAIDPGRGVSLKSANWVLVLVPHLITL